MCNRILLAKLRNSLTSCLGRDINKRENIKGTHRSKPLILIISALIALIETYSHCEGEQ